VDIPKWKRTAILAKYHPAAFARRLRIHPRALQRLCRKKFGCTGEQWLNALRFREARRLAAKGLKSKDIAKAVGCKSVPSFCRNFKSFHGKTVKQFRQGKSNVAQG
jgi:AraC-like DNA-binding protein